MNIIVNQNKLREAVSVLNRIVSKNVSLPILNTILLKTENGQLKLSATNLEMGINFWVSAKITKEGEVAVPAKIFSDFISNISDERLNLISEKNIMSINSDNYETKILGMEGKDFPLIPKTKELKNIKINSFTLKEALVCVIDSASLSDARPEIAGVFVNIMEEKAEFAATDSFRLSEKVVEIKNGNGKKIIIPRAAALELSRIIESKNEEISVVIEENQIFIFGENYEFISRLIDGRYPEYKKIIPEKFIAAVKVKKQDLEKNIRLAGIFSSSISDIRIYAEQNQIKIKAKNSEKGEIEASTPCELVNGEFEILVNYHYFLDGIKIIPTNELVIQFTGEGSPVVLKGDKDKNQTYLIMPLRS